MAELTAEAIVPFENIASFRQAILDSLAAHSLVLHPGPDGIRITAAFAATAWLKASDVDLELRVEADDPACFNRMKHALTSLIDFVARSEKLEIEWQGDSTGAALPPDMHILTVRAVRDLTPKMRRVRFSGLGLDGFEVPDQLHCRLLFPQTGSGSPQWPKLGDNGRIVWPEAGMLATRIYTVRRIDAAAGLLEIDFFLHDSDGPGMSWLAAAKEGDVVGILGPAAHGPRPASWYLLAGDETGLPGIARILEDLPATAEGVALIEIDNSGEEQALSCPAGIEIRWLHRNGAPPGTSRLLTEAAREIAFPVPAEELFIWLGAEFACFRELRLHWRRELGIPAARMVTYSHWRRFMSEDDIAAAGAEAVTA